MPYPNEHAARVRDPGDFKPDSFRRKNIQTGIDIIIGKLKTGDGSMVTQAYRFASDKFTPAEAKKWLKDNDIKYISFEPASGEKKSEENMLTRSVFALSDIEVRDEGGKKMIRGYAAVWDKPSLPICGMFTERIRRGAFKNSIEKNNIRSLWNHNPDKVLGSTRVNTLRLSEDDKGLRFENDLPDTQAGRDAFISISRGDVDGMSFGFRVLKQEWDEKDPKNVMRTLIDIDLREISPTPFPAYLQTKVTVRTIEDDYADHTAQLDEERNKNQDEINVRSRTIELNRRKLNNL